ncbi:MAG: hypothetical protein AB7O67_23675 [Vicinamibacterales bacterium]
MSTVALAFDPVRHEYRLPGGELVPSVTQILRDTGVSVDFQALSEMSADIGAAITLKRDIGTALHADAHAYDDDDLDWSTVNPLVEPYLRAWATFRANFPHLRPETRERQVFHGLYRYGGTLDGILVNPDTGHRVLVDLKTGDPEAAGARYQLAGYQLAYQFEHPETVIHERWSVQLTPDRQVPYRVHPYHDARDAQVWRSIVTTYYAQASRRRTAS